MSMSSSFVYGYGFHSDCDEIRLINFIKNHQKTFCESDREKELYEALDEYELEDLFEDYSCDATGTEGVGAVIANIMSRETGIMFEYCQPDDDCDTPASVIFEATYPWLLNETEKNLSIEKLSNIFTKYMNELGITDEPDYLCLEYFG